MADRLRRKIPVVAAAVALALALADAAIAHQDRIFQVSPEGEVLEIDAQYAPVMVFVGERPRSVSLRFGRHRVDLPACISRFFELPPSERLQVTGSWWHEESILPPYLEFTLPQRSAEHDVPGGYSLLFNLQTGALLSLTQYHTADGGRLSRDVPPESICSPSELRKLTPVAIPPTATAAQPASQETAP